MASISSVTGTWGLNNTLTVNGSGFGTKPSSTMDVYADFQDGLQPKSGQSRATAWDTTENRAVTSLPAVARWGNGNVSKSDGAGWTDTSPNATHLHLLSNLDYGDKYMVTLWRRWSNTEIGNWKILRIWSNAGYPNNYVGENFIADGDSNMKWEMENTGMVTNESRKYFSWTQPNGWWKRETYLVKINSAPGVLDGHLKIRQLRDGVGFAAAGDQVDDSSFRFDWSGATQVSTRLFFQDVKANGAVKSGFNTYWQECAADYGWARVEIGNASTYSACTKTELQPYVAWADGQIQIKCHPGTLASNSGSYLFFFDDNDTPTAGYDISSLSGGGGGNPAPTVTVVAPTVLSSTGGQIVLTGTDFTAAINNIKVNGVLCTGVVRDSATQITCNAPALGAGTYSIVVENSDGQTGTLTNGLLYITDDDISDTFTETSTVNLGSHTADSGHTWTGANTTDGTLKNNSTDDVGTTGASTNNFAVVNVGAPSPNYYVECVAKTGGTGTDRVGVVARWDVAASNGYILRLRGSTSDVELGVMTGGSITSLGTYTIPSFSSSTNYTLRLKVSGTSIIASVNGTERISVTDSTYTGAMPPGIVVRSNGNLPRMTSFIVNWAPVLTHLSVASGTTLGGEVIHLYGTNFPASITSVTFGGVAGTSIVRNSSTDVSVTVPAGSAGIVSIVLTGSDGQTSTLTGSYTYLTAATNGKQQTRGLLKEVW
jgi:hypothetical protein